MKHGSLTTVTPVTTTCRTSHTPDRAIQRHRHPLWFVLFDPKRIDVIERDEGTGELD